tara:strand:- start:495 stop:938 length:444 start_codon:yes stop_codon:yes gene_type:complete
MLSYIQSSIRSLNQSKLLLGIAMLLLNVGAKYVDLRFSKTQEQALRNGLAREMIIFAIVFMATHDIITSLLLTGAFVVLADYLFNDQSRFCIIPEHLRRIAMVVDADGDNRISPMEERNAIEVLRKADLQRNRRQQAEFMGYLQVAQ